MGPKTTEELELWTRLACALAANSNYQDVDAVRNADWMLEQWRNRRDAIEAAKRDAVEAERRAIREALNAAKWEADAEDDGEWTRFAAGKRDRVLLAAKDETPCIWRFDGGPGPKHGFYATEWPSDMGNPPPGWGAP